MGASLWWRTHPSACPYNQRFWVQAPHPLITRTMKLARHRKAPTMAITDATLSEVAKLAQIKLYYSSNSPAYVRSHTALLSVIQALAYGVYAQDTAQYDDRIRAFRLK